MEWAFGALSVALLLVNLGNDALASPVWMPQFVSGGSGRNIRHLPCVSRRTGETGVCMFAFACMKANGTHLGTCIDRFYFGSCCQLEGQDPALISGPDHGDNNTHDNHVPVLLHQPTTTTAEQHLLLSTFQTVHDNTIDATTERLSSAITTQKPHTTSTTQSTIITTTTKKSTTPKTTTRITTKRPRPTTTTTTRRPTRKPVTKPPPNRTTTKKPAPKPKPTTTTRRPPIKTSTAKPVTNKPVLTTSKPVVTTSKPVTTTLKPVVTTSRPVLTTSKPVTTTLKPVLSTAKIPASSTTPEYILVSSTNQTGSTAAAESTTTISTNDTGVNILEDARINETLSATTSAPSFITWTMAEDAMATTEATTTPSAPVTESSTSTSTATSTFISDGEELGSGDEGSGDSTPDWVLVPVSTPGDSEDSGTTSGQPTTEVELTSAPTAKPSIEITSSPVDVSTVTTTTAPLTEAPSSTLTTSAIITSTTTATPTDSLTNIEDIELFLNASDYKQVCGRRLFPESRIVGGEKATFGKWPWQISLRQWRTNTYLHKCGAALLNENWAITAAHCVENVPPADLLLRLGEHDLSTEEEPYGFQERRVQIVASHPQFDARTFEYDLALLRFYEPVTFQPNIIPICVPEDDRNFVGETAHVTGWGRLYEDGPLPSVLQEVSVPVINNTVCETMYRAAGYIEHIPNIFICAGWRKGGFDSCEGDSGGPMVIQRDDRRWLLAGVISWGIGCAEPNQPGVYTRISEFRDWINQILQF